MPMRHGSGLPESPGQASRPHPLITVFTLAVVAMLCFHFANVWLYLTPMNPIKIAFWEPVQRYIHPLFVQNWQLFAPAPIDRDELMMVKTRWRDRTTEQVWETEWIDLTTPVYHAIHRTRIGPYSKLARPFTGLQQMAVHTDPTAQSIRDDAVRALLERFRASSAGRRAGVPGRAAADSVLLQVIDSLSQPSEPEKFQRRMARQAMYRIATAHARKMVGPGGEVLAVNVRYASHRFPRFSARHRPSSDGSTTYGRPYGWARASTATAELP